MIIDKIPVDYFVCKKFEICLLCSCDVCCPCLNIINGLSTKQLLSSIRALNRLRTRTSFCNKANNYKTQIDHLSKILILC